MRLRAFGTMSGDHFIGGPSRVPRFLAAASPALVRSRIGSRFKLRDGAENVQDQLAASTGRLCRTSDAFSTKMSAVFTPSLRAASS